MARMTGPTQAERVVYRTSGPKKGLPYDSGTEVPLYADVQCSLPADVLSLDGGSLVPAGGTIPRVFITSTLESAQFQFPDVPDPVVYTRVDGGPVVALHPDTDARMDQISARVTAVEAGGTGDALLVHRDGAETITGVKAFSVSPTAPTPTTATQVAPKAYVDAAVARPTGILFSQLKADGTDESTLFLAELAQLQQNGGTWILPAGTIRVDQRIVIPTDGASTYPRQKSMRWVGTGAYSDPKGGAPPYPTLTGAGGTILDLRYTGGGSGLSKIMTQGKGLWESTGITYTDQGTSSNPFIKTTNTTLHFHHNAFVGNPTKSKFTCDQDVIILGGNTSVEGGAGEEAGFQGYGTVIKDNYFARTRRAVFGQVFCNAVVISDNNIWISCGSNLAGGAAIEINSGGVSLTVGNVITGNLIEMLGYIYGVKLDYSAQNTLAFNTFYDPDASSVACYRFESNQAKSNVVISTYYPNIMAVASQGGGSVEDYNTILQPLGSGTTSFGSLLYASNGLQTRAPGAGIGNQITFLPPSGASVVFKNYGRSWGWSDTTGGSLLIDTGNGGSNLDVRAFNLRLMRFSDGTTEMLRLRASPSSSTRGALQFNNTGPIWTTSTGTPEGVVTAPVGSICARDDGAAGTTFYVKESGAGNTGWVASRSVGPGAGQVLSADTVDAKGDLLVGTADNTVVRIPVGVDGQRLIADSTQAAGVRWSTRTFSVGDPLSAGGEAVADRRLLVASSSGNGSGNLHLTYFTAQVSETVNQLVFYTAGTATATPTLIRYAVYSVAVNGDLTLVASTVNDTTLLAATGARYSKATSAPWSKVAGQRYAVGALTVATTAPALMAISNLSLAVADAIFAQGPPLFGVVSGLADLPSSVTAGTVGVSRRAPYCEMLP